MKSVVMMAFRGRENHARTISTVCSTAYALDCFSFGSAHHMGM